MNSSQYICTFVAPVAMAFDLPVFCARVSRRTFVHNVPPTTRLNDALQLLRFYFYATVCFIIINPLMSLSAVPLFIIVFSHCCVENVRTLRALNNSYYEYDYEIL